MCCFGCSLELEPFAHWLHRRAVIASPMAAARKRALSNPLEQSEPNRNKSGRVTAGAENLVPASVGIVAGDLATAPDGALATSQGTSATVVEKGVETTTPFGVESPEISPKMPSDDATPTPPEVQQLIKRVAANVITTLHTFFKDHADALTGMGISVVGMPTHLYQCDALSLPTADSALDHTVSQLRPKVACAW